jgi:predicted transcriptional regulator of viral defense system
MVELIENITFPHNERRTRLSTAVLASLERGRIAVVTTYSLFHVLSAVLAGDKKGLYLRGDASPASHIDNVRKNLLGSRAIEIDPDYGRSVYRVLSLGESSAEEVCALANPFGYISHLSAMQRWGLTERRPEALYLTMPPASAARALIETRMAEDYGTSDYSKLPNNAWLESLPPSVRSATGSASLEPPVKLHFVRHPEVVRGRRISVYETRRPSHWLQVQDSHARLATIGQTFVNMVERPQYCGGMAHVIDVWRQHADTFREEIISTIEEVGIPIAKVRAGYLLDEVLAAGDDSRVQGWVQFATRGSSRILDPTKDFSSTHSEKWMLSINV